MKVNKFKIYTLGCKVNFYDSADFEAALLESGFEKAKDNADLAIINTCSVTKSAIKKDRKMIARARKENPKAKIFFTGCFVRVYPKESEKIEGVKIFKDFQAIFDYLKIKPQKKARLAKENRARYFIKIQDGCNQFCSYCVIPYARGPLTSRSQSEVLAEIKLAIESGFEEIVLSGIHLGLYNNRGDLASLIKKIIKIKDLGRIRLSSIEITEVNDELIRLIGESKKICNHLHIPLQAGSDKILKLMNRPYDTAYFEKQIKKIRKSIPDIAITTDVIVGFPGETKENFEETFEFIKKIKFSRLHVFSFSAHEKTPAFNLPDRVRQNTIVDRAGALRRLSLALEKEFNGKVEGKKREILIIRKVGENFCGKDEHYIDFCFKASLKRSKIGKIVKIGNKK